MPHNLAELINEHPWFGGFIMAILTSLMRIIYDHEETSLVRILLESLICGAITLTIGSGLMELGYGPGWYLACGGSVGFMGSQTIRAFAYKVIKRKTG